MADPVLGEIRPFAGNYAPVGWEICAGQSLSVSAYTALFSLLGTTWGGNGVTTFNLPDLRGRLPVGQGQGTGLTNRVVGQMGGSSTVQVTDGNMPPHTHSFTVSGNEASMNTPATYAMLASPQSQPNGTMYAYAPATGTGITQQQFNAGVVTDAPGGSQPHQNLMPYLAINYIIAVSGTYPQRPS
jgi:microcystin-dependent protein